MEQPDQKKTGKYQAPPLPEEGRGAKVSLARKIIIGVLIAGYWIFFYWFREP
jgi:hypothetical protein